MSITPQILDIEPGFPISISFNEVDDGPCPSMDELQAIIEAMRKAGESERTVDVSARWLAQWKASRVTEWKPTGLG